MKIKLCLVLFCVILNSFFVIASEKDSLSIIEKDRIEKEKIKDEFDYLQELDKKFPIQDDLIKKTSPEFNFTAIEKEFSPTPIDISKTKEAAKAWFEKIKKLKKWVSSLKIDQVEEFPVGIRKELNGVEYQLGFVKAKFTKNYTELTIYFEY